jgi:hypothetical protein
VVYGIGMVYRDGGNRKVSIEMVVLIGKCGIGVVYVICHMSYVIWHMAYGIWHMA